MSREASDAFADAVDRHWREHGWGLWAVDPTADLDHPHVDALAYPDLVRQVLYRLGHEQWRARLR